MSLPKDEFRKRIGNVKRLIEKKNIDFAFVYFDEYNVMNGRYLTGWCPSVERGAVIVSRYGEPFLIGGPEAGPYARLESAVEETVSSMVFMVPEEEYPAAEIFRFDQIAERHFAGKKIKKIGVAGINTVPHSIYSRLVEEMKGAELVDITDDFERLRYVKSGWELEMTAKAYDIADSGFEKLKQSIVEGNKEHEAAAEAEYVARKMGGDGYGYRTIVGSGERAIGIIPAASERVFKKGELVLTGFAPRFNGYNATACFPVVVGGKPDGEQEKWITDVCEALYVTKEALKPGLTGVEIDGVPRGFLSSRGYADYMPMPFVHSSGLCEFEKPFFGPTSRDVIQKDQVICIDIALFGHERIRGIRVETGYRITEKGAEPFSPYLEKLCGF
jgi:Xaa-Pro aminopeptidase